MARTASIADRARCYHGGMATIERSDTVITLTEAAADKIKQLMAEENEVAVLRVAVQGGGCSGFEYALGFDRGAQEGDHELEHARRRRSSSIRTARRTSRARRSTS